jgi:phosphoribosyl-ATP pyrophosphohydrolase
MNANILEDLNAIILDRKVEKFEGSYTCYLFEKGLDKILKKCGEECAEMIIAAKNGDNIELCNEACDLLYHMLVLLAERNVPLSNIIAELSSRAEKQKNLKPSRPTDKNS